MKKIYSILLLSIFCLMHFQGLAQGDKQKTRRPAVRLGINFGGAWQTSDVRWIPGLGTGVTLEVPIIENDHSLIGISLRGRYLFSGTFGKDWKRTQGVSDLPSTVAGFYSTQGYYYANHATSSNNWDLELMLKANRLRAKTGILAYVWGGIGAMGYRTKLDQYQTFIGSPHNYSSISEIDKGEALRDLRFEWDGRYETEANAPSRPHWVFAPSLGIGLGYEFSPLFSLAFEYKVTFPFTDDLDGKRTGLDGLASNDNDIHHYGGFGVYFGLFGGGAGTSNPKPRPRPNPRPTAVRPQIKMVTPTTASVNVSGSCLYDMQARIYNVRNKALITVTMNGYTLNPDFYSYEPSTGTLRARLQLNPGNNVVKILVRNQHGTDTHTFSAQCSNVILPPPPPSGLPPEVYITYPTGCPAIIHDCRTVIHAEVYRVRSKNDITVYHYNQLVSPQFYTYDAYSRQLTMNVELDPGDNRFEIIARNAFGEARASTILRCPAQVTLPAVVITKPSISPYSSANCTQMIEARVSGVRSRADITVRVDGIKQPNSAWSWSASTTILRMTVNLVQGRDATVEILASNGNGCAADIQVLRCEQTLPPPVVIIVNPANGQYAGKDCNQRITARVLNVSGKQNIRVMQGRRTVSSNSWTYSTFNQLLVMDVTLTPSVQTPFTITGTNTVGTDSKTATLRCEVEQVQMITICHIPPGNPADVKTISIPQTTWASHQAHGDIQGPCSTTMIQVCLDGQSLSVSQSAWPAFQSMGATQGPCQVRQIQICHIPPSNPAAAATLTIPVDLWPQHQAHGDIKGRCSSTMVTICYRGRQMSVSQTVWAIYQGLGATQGPCPTANISICHIPPGNPAGAASIMIPADQWPSHQSHGDVKGSCSKLQVKVCIDGNEIQISQTALQVALAMGAIQGPCPVTTIQICHIPPRNPAAASTMTIQASAWADHAEHGDIQAACSKRQIQICWNGRTISIPANIWPAMQAKGATQGPCLASNITICHIPPGNPAAATTMVIQPKQWAVHQSHGDVKGACSVQTVTMCIDGNSVQISQTALQFALAMGAVQGPCAPTSIQICHIPPKNPAAAQTMTIPANQWAMHSAHGDLKAACSKQKMTICFNGREVSIPKNIWPNLQAKGATQGPCPTAMIDICHIPPARPLTAKTMKIAAKEWPTHQAHGDVKGPCSPSQVTVCLRGQQVSITRSALPAVLKAGGTQGPCPPKQIKICHIPPGDPFTAATMEISATDWPSHQAHGDVKGACSTTMVTVCWDANQFQITQTALQAALNNGATSGPCPAAQIQICHIPPATPQTARTISIPENQWPMHQVHGDVQGPCSASKMLICYQGTNYAITPTAWPVLQSKGAVQGPCPTLIKMCHLPPGQPNQPENIEVTQEDYYTHLAHGDVAGDCNYTPMTICHQDPNNSDSRKAIQIPTSSWNFHQQHGDIQGECPLEIKICHIPPGGLIWPTTMMIPEEEWETHIPHIDHKGECSHVEIQICHTPPGTTNKVDVTISESAWRYHELHGDTRGTCPESSGGGGKSTTPSEGSGTIKPKTVEKPKTVTKPKTVVKPKTVTKPKAVVKPGGKAVVKPGGKAAVKASGKTITICHKPPKNPNRPVTMKIPTAQWPIHKKHGDTTGPCPTGKKAR